MLWNVIKKYLRKLLVTFHRCSHTSCYLNMVKVSILNNAHGSAGHFHRTLLRHMVTFVHYRPRRDGGKRWVVETQRTTEVSIYTDGSLRKTQRTCRWYAVSPHNQAHTQHYHT